MPAVPAPSSDSRVAFQIVPGATGRVLHPIHESEMALFSERMQGCARKVLDTADIVREPILSQKRDSFGLADDTLGARSEERAQG